MLGKLLKYHLIFIYKILWIFYLMIIVFSVFMRLCAGAEQTMVISVLKGIMTSVAISFMFSAVINNMFRCWGRFKNHLYGDESYLTHTLPIGKTTIYFSHFLSVLISMGTSIIFSVIGVFIMFYSKENMQFISAALKGLAEGYSSSPAEIIIIFTLLVFTQMLFIITVGDTGMVIGHRAESGKLGKSILAGFVIYSIAQMTILAITFVVGIFDADVMLVFTESAPSNLSVLRTVLYLCASGYCLVNIICVFLGIRMFGKGVNVE